MDKGTELGHRVQRDSSAAKEVIEYVFCALCMVCPGSAFSWNSQDCNRESMQRVQNTWSIGTGLGQNAQTQMLFSKQRFS